MGLRVQPRHETFVTLFGKAGSNVVECAAILVEFVAAPIVDGQGVGTLRNDDR